MYADLQHSPWHVWQPGLVCTLAGSTEPDRASVGVHADPVSQSDCTCNCSCRCMCRPPITGILVTVPVNVPADHLVSVSIAVPVTVLLLSLYLLIMSHKIPVVAFAFIPEIHSSHDPKVDCVVHWLHRLHMLSWSGLQQAHGQDSFCHAQAKPTNCRSSQVPTCAC